MIHLDDIYLTLNSRAGPVNILRGIYLSIAGGEAAGMVGPSGSGKSTLMSVMAGLEKPSSGRVTIDGQDITGMDEDALARFRRGRIGIVFQSFHLIPTMTALENVAVPLELMGDKDAFARAAEELKVVGLGARTEHYPGQLSGGEQQRVALARALITAPRILLLDEPFSALDAALRETLRAEFQQRIAQAGMAVVWVTHDEAEARSVGARGLRLLEGALQALW